MLFALVVASLAVASGAHADITHRVSFSVGPQFVAWTDDGRVHRGDQLALSVAGEAVPMAPASAPVMTGSLLQVSTNTPTPRTVRLALASNTGFQVTLEGKGAGTWRARAQLEGAGPSAAIGALQLMPEATVHRTGDSATLMIATERTAAR
ncbi:MAG: hypothetical protein AAFR33_09270, partial [Pseudomonadota bacterium]